MNNKTLQKHALNIRKSIIEMVYAAQSGHPGGSLGCTEIVTELYFEQMNINSKNIGTTDRDRFVLSKGHCSPTLYGALMEKGLLNDDPHTFRLLGSRLQGHPDMKRVPGVDMSTGSLGQGISTAVGMAIANKLDGKKHRVYALCGDGESEEGIVWEALMSAAHYNLDNLCVIFDVNGLQIDGKVQDIVGPLPLDKKAKAFGCNVINVKNGHDFDELRKAFADAKACKGKPTVIVAHTIKGKGVSYMENQVGWHGVAPNKEQYEQAVKELKGVKL